MVLQGSNTNLVGTVKPGSAGPFSLSFQRHTERRKVQQTSVAGREIPEQHKEKGVHKVFKEVEKFVQRSCAISILGDTQNSSGKAELQC